MQRRTSAPRFSARSRRGVSSIVGAVFFVLIVLVAMAGLVTVFNSYSGYQKAVTQADASKAQADQTSLSFPSFQFGSPSSPVTMATGGTTAPGATQYPGEGKLFYGNSLWWSIYSDGTSVVCRTSPDGLTWSGATALLSPPAATTVARNVAKEASCFSTTCSENIGGSQTAGDVLAFTLGWYGGPAPTSVSDTLGDTFSLGVSSSVSIPQTPTFSNSVHEASCNHPSCNVAFGGPGVTASGDIVILNVGWLDSPAPTSVTDTLGNTYILGASANVTVSPDTYYSSIYYATSSGSGGDTITVTFSSAVNSMESAYDVTGATATGAVTSSGSSSANTGTASVSAFSPAANSFVTANIEVTAKVNPWTPGAGYTIDGGSGPCNKNQGCAEYDPTASGSQTASMSMVPSVGFVEVAMAFPPASLTYYSNIYYATSVASGGDTITATFASTINSMVSAYDIGGVTASLPQTSTGTSSTAVGASAVASFTPVSNSFVIANVETNIAVNPWTQGAGYTIQGGAGSCNNYQGCSEYEMGSGTATTAPMTMVPNVGYAEAAIAFSPPIYNEGYAVSVYVSGTTLYLADGQNPGGADNAFTWEYGTLSSSGCGSISWSISDTPVTTSYSTVGPITVETDGSGNTWIALTSQTGANYYVEVWEHASGAGAGSWTQVKTVGPAATEPLALVEPWVCTGTGCAVMVYGSALVTGATSITSTSCSPTCSTWTSPVTSPGTSNYAMDGSSAVTITSTLYFAGLRSSTSGQTSGTLDFWAFEVGAASFPSETTIESSSAQWEAALSSSTSTLVLFEATQGGTTVYARSSLTYGNIWSPAAGSSAYAVTTSATSIGGLTAARSGTFAAMWSSGSSSPFNLKFFAFSMLSVVDQSPFAVQGVSLYLAQPSTNAVVQHYDTDGTTSGAAGPFSVWIGAGSQMDVPLLPNVGGVPFNWSPSTAYLVTLTTRGGVVSAESVTSPA